MQRISNVTDRESLQYHTPQLVELSAFPYMFLKLSNIVEVQEEGK